MVCRRIHLPQGTLDLLILKLSRSPGAWVAIAQRLEQVSRGWSKFRRVALPHCHARKPWLLLRLGGNEAGARQNSIT